MALCPLVVVVVGEGEYFSVHCFGGYTLTLF